MTRHVEPAGDDVVSRRVRSANLRRRPMSVDRESVSADPWCRPVSLVRSHREHPRSWPSRHRTPSTSDSRPVGRRPRSRAAGSGRRVQHGGPHPMGGEQRELDVESSVTRDPGPVRHVSRLSEHQGDQPAHRRGGLRQRGRPRARRRLVIALPELRRLVTEDTTLGDLILQAFLQRRIIRRRSAALLDGAGRRSTDAGGPRRPLLLGR